MTSQRASARLQGLNVDERDIMTGSSRPTRRSKSTLENSFEEDEIEQEQNSSVKRLKSRLSRPESEQKVPRHSSESETKNQFSIQSCLSWFKVLICFPFLWSWNFLCSVTRFLSKPFVGLLINRDIQQDTTDTTVLTGKSGKRLTGTTRRAAAKTKKPDLQTDPDLSEDEEFQEEIPKSFCETFLLYFTGNDSDISVADIDDNSSAKTGFNQLYVQIPSDTLTNEQLQHETDETGLFVPQKYSPIKESKRSNLCCYIVPFLLILIPFILLLSLCWRNPDILGQDQDSICHKLIEHSSHLSEYLNSGFVQIGHICTSIFEDYFEPLFSKSFEISAASVSALTDQIIGATKYVYSGFENGAQIVTQSSENFLFYCSDSISSIIHLLKSKETTENATTTTESAISKVGQFFSNLVFALFSAGYNLIFAGFSAILYIFTWTWVLLW